ncbi:hypothetical protein HGD90_01710 [Rhodobacteraceae bacterium R_SAG7]|nr:hypothetical protein [Rhodobacteraceae bacterium R_SAG7]
MTGWKIFSHSLNMVLRNIIWAFRIALLPTLLGTAVSAALLWGDLAALAEAEAGGLEPPFPTGLLLKLLVTSPILIAIQLWAVVAWHRFVLLEEYPTGWIPPFYFDRILAYVGRVLMVALILGVVWMLFGLLLGISMQISPVIAVVLVIPGIVGIGLYIFRLLPLFAAAAIGKPMTMNESIAATKGSAGAAILLFVVLAIVQIGLQLVTAASTAIFAPLGIVFYIGSIFVMTMVNVSILTTIYGYYVEKRPI